MVAILDSGNVLRIQTVVFQSGTEFSEALR